jgi:hypothetical protein
MESAWDLAVDQDPVYPQHIWVGGEFTDSLVVNGVSYISNGLSDCFVTKYGVEGQLQWVQVFGSTEPDICLSIASDIDGNCYFTGFCNGPITYNGQQTTHTGMWDGFYGKLDPTGEILWLKSFGGPLNDIGYGIEAGQDGSFYITGWFADTIQFSDTVSITSFGGSDIFLAKFDPDGNPIWARHAGGPGVEYGYKVDTPWASNLTSVYITGSASPGSDFGGVITDAQGMFVACYDSIGTCQWVLPSYNAGAINIAVDSHITPNVNAVIGRVTGSATIGDTVINSVNGSDDIYIAHFDCAGNWLGVEQYGGPGSDKGRAVDIKYANLEISLSSFEDEVDFGDFNLISNGYYDIAVKDESRPPVSAGSMNSDVGTDVKWLDDHRFVVTGWFSGLMRFGQHILDSGSETNMNYFTAVYDYQVSDVDDAGLMPAAGIHSYPNPGSGYINIDCKKSPQVDIFNLKGQLVRRLESLQTKDGISSFGWDTLDASGIRCPSGVYLVKTAGGCARLLLLDK